LNTSVVLLSVLINIQKKNAKLMLLSIMLKNIKQNMDINKKIDFKWNLSNNIKYETMNNIK
jgi:hypothetical protein